MSLPLILLVVIADVHSYISEHTQSAMLLSALISFFAIITLAACNLFINPPPQGSGQLPLTWQVGSIQEVSWSTDAIDLSLTISSAAVDSNGYLVQSFDLSSSW